jgi:hypothetical protein
MKFPTDAKPALHRPISVRPRLVKKNEPPREPTPFTLTSEQPRESADIDVRPYDPVYHVPYLLKGLWNTVPDRVTDESTWDSGLIILPHRPKNGKRTRRRRQLGQPNLPEERKHEWLQHKKHVIGSSDSA